MAFEYEKHLMTTAQVAERMAEALEKKEKLSIVRIGDGEALALCHDVLIPTSKIEANLDYSGVQLPDPNTREILRQSIMAAEIVGLLPEERRVDIPKIFAHFKITTKAICSAYINWDLHGNGKGLLYPLLRDRRVYLVGRRAHEAVYHARQLDMNVVGFTGCEGIYDVEEAYAAIRRGPDFDIALVAAGIPAVVLCPMLAERMGKVAFDFGHVLDDIIKPGFRNEVREKEAKAIWRSQFNGILIKGSGPEVYVIQDGKIRHIASLEVMAALGFRGNQVLRISDLELGFYRRGKPITIPDDYWRKEGS